MKTRRSGPRAVILDVELTPAAVAAAVRQLAANKGLSIAEVVPGAATVLVVAADPSQLTSFMAALPELDVQGPADSASSGEVLEIPVRYDGPDLSAVASSVGVSFEEVVRRHSSVTYQAAFTGFAPGFAYLTGLDPRLALPRRATPRPSVPPGSLAIADIYTAIYPRSSPGGWHLIGTTDLDLFVATRTPPALVAPGDLVRFVPTD